jgi:hypothetical protein
MSVRLEDTFLSGEDTLLCGKGTLLWRTDTLLCHEDISLRDEPTLLYRGGTSWKSGTGVPDDKATLKSA